LTGVMPEMSFRNSVSEDKMDSPKTMSRRKKKGGDLPLPF
jgi:hypothetical protein